MNSRHVQSFIQFSLEHPIDASIKGGNSCVTYTYAYMPSYTYLEEVWPFYIWVDGDGCLYLAYTCFFLKDHSDGLKWSNWSYYLSSLSFLIEVLLLGIKYMKALQKHIREINKRKNTLLWNHECHSMYMHTLQFVLYVHIPFVYPYNCLLIWFISWTSLSIWSAL